MLRGRSARGRRSAAASASRPPESPGAAARSRHCAPRPPPPARAAGLSGRDKIRRISSTSTSSLRELRTNATLRAAAGSRAAARLTRAIAVEVDFRNELLELSRISRPACASSASTSRCRCCQRRLDRLSSDPRQLRLRRCLRAAAGGRAVLRHTKIIFSLVTGICCPERTAGRALRAPRRRQPEPPVRPPLLPQHVAVPACSPLHAGRRGCGFTGDAVLSSLPPTSCRCGELRERRARLPVNPPPRNALVATAEGGGRRAREVAPARALQAEAVCRPPMLSHRPFPPGIRAMPGRQWRAADARVRLRQIAGRRGVGDSTFVGVHIEPLEGG